jgi:thiol:disulfide interchange protein DsbC
MRVVFGAALLLSSVIALPETGLADPGVERLKRILAERLSGEQPDYVSPSPVEGLYEVGVGAQVFYVSADGRYLMSGRLIDLDNREDLTESRLAKRRLKLLAAVPQDSMIIFSPEGEVKYTLTTFTDIDCPYCRKMHRDMSQLNGYGIRVRYLAFPRAGVESISYEKAVSVWCAADQRDEMTLAKGGKLPTKRSCENPVTEHMAVGERLGLTGTPFSITDTGRVISGYRSAASLLRALQADQQGSQR